jgi:competence protein ComEC
VRLPILWIAIAFASGIALASHVMIPPRMSLIAVAIGIAVGAALLAIHRNTSAWALALFAWLAIGGLAFSIEQASIPANHITRLIAANRLDTATALRWRGRLREDPAVLPWGRRYEIDLENVELAAAYVSVSGGLRASLYGDGEPSGVTDSPRAGDRVEALLRARPPRNFLDPGAFDFHDALARQKIDLTGSLRSGELLRLIDRPTPTLAHRIARARGALLARLDSLFSGQPERAAVLRAMLLGDRSFVDSELVTAFQKTAVYHVLVVAGLHVGAFAAVLFWFGRRARLPLFVTVFLTLAALGAYLAVVQDRPPILRAALMAALYLVARPLFRRIDLLNTIAVAAFVVLLWRPSSLFDSSFQLSFVAAIVIAGLALPWIERSGAPYLAGLAHLGDVTRDATHPPKVAQFRLDLRAASRFIAARLPGWLAARSNRLVVAPVGASLHLWEIVLLSFVIQWGMLPLLTSDFHRVSIAGPVSNIPSVILTGLIVPFGFLTLLVALFWSSAAVAMAKGLGVLVACLLSIVEWFSRRPHLSNLIPGPPIRLLLAFFAAYV